MANSRIKVNSSGCGSAVLVILLVILLFAIAAALSWGVVALIYWLITICFGLNFSFMHVTGIWLIMFLIGMATGGCCVKVNKNM